MVKDGKLFGALTRAVIGPGEERPIRLITPGVAFFDPHPDDIGFWEQLEPVDAPSAAAAGCPFVVGRLLSAGWRPE